MAVATARLAASLARPAHCPLCGTNSEPNVIALPGLRISCATRRVWIAGAEVKLTGMEYRLLEYLAKRPDAVVTKKQLYQDVWGFQIMPRGTRTVDSHVSRLRRKLSAVDGNAIVIEAAWGTGWRFRPGST